MKIKHDDFCPCARFHTQPEFCTCGAVTYAEEQEASNKRFGDRLLEINRRSTPPVNAMGNKTGGERT